jgi:hypothetical protein
VVCTSSILRTQGRTREYGSRQTISKDTRSNDQSGLRRARSQPRAQAGADFDWHFGRVTSLGTIGITDSRTVTILWEEGGISSQQGDITDEQWEIFKLAFVSTGRIAILSDQPEKNWMYDYRFLESVRW